MLGDHIAFVADRPLAVQVLLHQDSGLGEAGTLFCRRHIDRQTAQSNAVVVCHGGFVGEGDLRVTLPAIDFGEGAFSVQWGHAEPFVVVGDVIFLQPTVGILHVRDPVELELGDQAILHGPEVALDPALGLWGQGANGLDTQLMQDPANVCGILLTHQLLLMAPEVIRSSQSRMAVLVHGQGHSVAPDDHVQKSEIGHRGLRGDKQGRQQGAVGIVDGAHQATRIGIGAEPVVRAAVPLHHDPGLFFSRSAPVAALAASFSLRGLAGSPQDLTDLLPAQEDALTLGQGLGEVGVVEVAVDLFVQGDHDSHSLRGQSVADLTAPVAVGETL